MKLLRFKYWEHESSGEEWEIEPLQFRDFNLIVGRNATGKTRLLKAIARVAGEISGERKPESRNLRYELKIDGDNGAELTWAHRAQYLPFTGQLNLRRAGTGAPSFLSVEQAFQQGENAGCVPSRNAGEPSPASVDTCAFQPSGVGRGLGLNRNTMKTAEPPRMIRSRRTTTSLRISRGRFRVARASLQCVRCNVRRAGRPSMSDAPQRRMASACVRSLA